MGAATVDRRRSVGKMAVGGDDGTAIGVVNGAGEGAIRELGFDDVAAGIISSAGFITELVRGLNGFVDGVIERRRLLILGVNCANDLTGGIVNGLGGNGADVRAVIGVDPFVTGAGLIAIIIVGEGAGEAEGVGRLGEVAARYRNRRWRWFDPGHPGCW